MQYSPRPKREHVARSFKLVSAACHLFLKSRGINTVIALFLLVSAAFAQDWFGFNTHYKQGDPFSVFNPLVPKYSGAIIRDEIGWGDVETSKGVYSMPSLAAKWINSAAANGVKVDVLLNFPCPGYPNAPIYPDPFDPVQYGKMAGALAGFLRAYQNVVAIEILNEPNNQYQSVEGPTWKDKYPILFNDAYAAIKAANPNIQVIGIGAQGDDNFYILSKLTHLDGFTDHPYAAFYVPENSYEPPYNSAPDSYRAYVAAIRANTKAPIWETEWGIGSDSTEYEQALFTVRRLLLSAGVGIEHTIIYEFWDQSSGTQGVLKYHGAPKRSALMIQRVVPLLNGKTPLPGSVTVEPTGSIDSADLFTEFFADNLSSVVACWIGNHDPNTANYISYGATIVFPQRNHFRVTALDPMTGATWTPKFTVGEDKIIVSNIQITNAPILYIADYKLRWQRKYQKSGAIR